MKKLSAVLSILLMLVLTAVPAFSAFADSYDYYIENYDINMKVMENNTVRVTENIDAYFNIQKHGILRYIPIECNVNRARGDGGVVKAKVKSVSVSENYEAYTDDYNNYVIQIGDEDKTFEGEHSYTVSYDYVMGKDIGEGFDELYYNIIGDGWDTYIKNVTFKIEMPKEFDQSKVGFSSGAAGTVGSGNILYTCDGNTITGSLIGGLNPYEALTVRIELEEGYFKFDLFAYYLKIALMIIIPLICLVTVLALWSKYGKDKKIVDVVEFYPPDNLNSAETAFWYKGSLSSKDTIALLIELANEGYVNIVQTEKKKLLKKDSFTIEKAREYDGADINKKIFFNGLFKGTSSVTEDDLSESFYVTANTIVGNISSSKNVFEMFDKKSIMMVVVGALTSIIGAAASILIYNSGFGTGTETLAVIFAFLLSVISLIMSFFIRRRTEKGHQLKQRINGFKIFLETAEKEKLEAMVEENPKYYYDILPYAYVLGVSDKWTKNFEGIVLEPPEWYYGSTFDRIMFWHFMNSTMSRATEAMTSTPQTSSSSMGGGGFSGGGAGGGGGGSW
ncbi:MAG: DUF2207 domain-containing protein [Eubacterium sp.]